MRAGMGHALCGASADARGPSASRMWGRSTSSVQVAFISWMRRPPPRSTPKPTLARPSGSGNDQAYPGSRSGSNHTHSRSRRRAGHAAEVLAEGVPLAEVARWGQAEVLAQRGPHAVGADHEAGDDGAEAVDVQLDGAPVAGRRSGEGVPVVHLDATGAGHVDEGGVQLGPRGDGGELASAHGHRQLDRAAGR